MTSLKPYLIRAIYDWVVDNSYTPYMLVNAEADEVSVPQRYVQDGKIVLNLHPQAVMGLSLGNQAIGFNARFGGASMQVQFPVAAVLAIYAKENGKGLIFDEDGDGDLPPPAPTSGPSKKKPPKPTLKVVK